MRPGELGRFDAKTATRVLVQQMMPAAKAIASSGSTVAPAGLTESQVIRSIVLPRSAFGGGVVVASVVAALGQPASDTVRCMAYSYKVVEVREKMMGGKMSGEKLEKLLNEHAAQGWQLKAITSVEVKGRVGPGGVEGLLVTFERATA